MYFCWLSGEHRFINSNFFYFLIECSGPTVIDLTQEDSGDECIKVNSVSSESCDESSLTSESDEEYSRYFLPPNNYLYSLTKV